MYMIRYSKMVVGSRNQSSVIELSNYNDCQYMESTTYQLGDLMRKYIKSFLTISSNLLSSENISEEQKQKLTKWKACIEQDKSTFDPNKVAEFIIKDDAKTKEILYSDEELKLLDFETAKSYLKTPQNHNSYEYARWCMFQALSL